MKSLPTFLSNLIQDLGEVCGVSTSRDWNTISSRVEEEGLSFLTITLPSFCKSFEAALEAGRIGDDHFPGFRRVRGGLPAFLQGFLRLVFTPKGVLSECPAVDAIRAVRQICLTYSKIELECSTKRIRSAFSQYIQCENDLAELEIPLTSQKDLRKVFLLLFGNLMHDVGQQADACELVPKHGPGSTADRLSGNRKWLQREWPSRLERSFPMDSYLIPNHRYWKELSRVKIVEPRSERPVRVIAVPKTLKTPRIIAIEPTAMQYAQQAMMLAIRGCIDRDPVLQPLVGLDDQDPNRSLAQRGSVDRLKATLDLSEASDRVSNQLVWFLTSPYMPFARALQDCRSKRADVPGHGVQHLRKFASMGSALCFPIEGMVFSAISILGCIRARAYPLSPSSVKRIAKEVRVFGDDIIVPSDCAKVVSEHLSHYGLKVNIQKSFSKGYFRESCGGDYYAGVDVSVHRLRQAVPDTIRDARGVAALFSFRNKCYISGYWKTARAIDTHLESLGIPLPRVSNTSPVLGRLSFLGYDSQRTSPTLHAPLVRGVHIVGRPPTSLLSGVAALQKILVLHRNEPLFEDHLERQGRPKSVRTKIGWGQPF